MSCKCGHPKSDHIYEEGACRPGSLCSCQKFTPVPSTDTLMKEVWCRDKIIGDMETQTLEMMLEIKTLKTQLMKAHQHILWLQDGWNEIRNFLSWVKHEPATEEMDEEIDLSDLDDTTALELRDYTEEFAMAHFQTWYSKINEVQDLKHLDDYESFKHKEIP